MAVCIYPVITQQNDVGSVCISCNYTSLESEAVLAIYCTSKLRGPTKASGVVSTVSRVYSMVGNNVISISVSLYVC